MFTCLLRCVTAGFIQTDKKDILLFILIHAVKSYQTCAKKNILEEYKKYSKEFLKNILTAEALKICIRISLFLFHCYLFEIIKFLHKHSSIQINKYKYLVHTLGLDIYASNEVISPTPCVTPTLPLPRNTSGRYITPLRGESWAIQMVTQAIFLQSYCLQNIL